MSFSVGYEIEFFINDDILRNKYLILHQSLTDNFGIDGHKLIAEYRSKVYHSVASVNVSASYTIEQIKNISGKIIPYMNYYDEGHSIESNLPLGFHISFSSVDVKLLIKLVLLYIFTLPTLLIVDRHNFISYIKRSIMYPAPVRFHKERTEVRFIPNTEKFIKLAIKLLA